MLPYLLCFPPRPDTVEGGILSRRIFAVRISHLIFAHREHKERRTRAFTFICLVCAATLFAYIFYYVYLHKLFRYIWSFISLNLILFYHFEGEFQWEKLFFHGKSEILHIFTIFSVSGNFYEGNLIVKTLFLVFFIRKNHNNWFLLFLRNLRVFGN